MDNKQSKQAHTPGPWMLDAYNQRYVVHDTQSDIGVLEVAICQDEATARLIAAAPDFMNALQKIADAQNGFDELQFYRNIARAALVKAGL
jgi:hypothetical protein